MHKRAFGSARVGGATDPARQEEIARLREAFVAGERAEYARRNPKGDLSETAIKHHVGAIKDKVESPKPARNAASIEETSRDADEIARLRDSFLAGERAEHMRKNPGGNLSDAAIKHRPKASKKASLKLPKPEESTVGTVYLLWALLGPVSGHRFYLGATWSAVLQAGLLALGLFCFFAGGIEDLFLIFAGVLGMMFFGFWFMADLFLIPRLHRKREAGEYMRNAFI